MQVPIFSGTQQVGTLETCRQGLYTKFSGTLRANELCRVYAVFSGDEISLGIPVPDGDRMRVRSTMPTNRLPTGNLTAGRLVYEKNMWQPFSGGTIGCVRYPAGERKENRLRFPWRMGEPLPADEVCCFYRYREIGGKTYLELTLTADGTPAISE